MPAAFGELDPARLIDEPHEFGPITFGVPAERAARRFGHPSPIGATAILRLPEEQAELRDGRLEAEVPRLRGSPIVHDISHPMRIATSTTHSS